MPEPGEVVEIRYLYCLRGGSLYQPVLIGKRNDVDQDECSAAQIKYKEEAVV
jgi:hypothetical protein